MNAKVRSCLLQVCARLVVSDLRYSAGGCRVHRQTAVHEELLFAAMLVEPDCHEQLGSSGAAEKEALLRGSQGWTAELWKFATRVRMCLCNSGGWLGQCQGTRHVLVEAFGVLHL